MSNNNDDNDGIIVMRIMYCELLVLSVESAPRAWPRSFSSLPCCSPGVSGGGFPACHPEPRLREGGRMEKVKTHASNQGSPPPQHTMTWDDISLASLAANTEEMPSLGWANTTRNKTQVLYQGGWGNGCWVGHYLSHVHHSELLLSTCSIPALLYPLQCLCWKRGGG